MPLIPPAKHSGLIVASFWQNNHGHPTLEDFEQETRMAIAEAGNLSLQGTRGGSLPNVTLQHEAPARRFAAWVLMLQQPESANAVATRLKERWMGRSQGGITRRMDVGSGYAPRGNFAKVLGVRSTDIYASAFEELKLRTRGVAGDGAHPQAVAIADYLWEILANPEG